MKHVFWPVRKKESISCWKTHVRFLRLLPPDERGLRKNGVLLQVGHVQRYIPQNRAARALIESGKLGVLAMISDLRTNNYFQPGRPRWFLEKRWPGAASP